MSLIGLQIYLALKFIFLIPKKNVSTFLLLIGISIPEIDSIFVFISNIFASSDNKIYLFDKNLTHSIISIGIIYLLFLIIYEIKKNDSILKAGNGIVFGMIINITFDLLIRIGNIDIFWPLPIATIEKYQYSNIMFNTFLIMEFIFFRLMYNEFINLILKKGESSSYIKYLSYWMKILTLFIFIFLITIIFFNSIAMTIFNLLYVISYLTVFVSIYKLKEIIK